jgi:hypothetical protein
MALISCRECGQKVSSKADKCVHCGIEKPSAARVQGEIIMKVVGVALALCLGIFVYFQLQSLFEMLSTAGKPKTQIEESTSRRAGR